MSLDFGSLNWFAILLSIVVGQVISTVWFTALFGDPWARAYGAESKEQHTKEVPMYTYAVGLLSTAVLTISIALLQRAMSISTIGGALLLGIVLAIGICCATMLPGQAFLKRYSVFLIAAGSQSAMLLVISIILALWQ